MEEDQPHHDPAVDDLGKIDVGRTSDLKLSL